MSIRFATPTDLARLLRLCQYAHATFDAGGREDIERMVQTGTVSLGEERGELWGMAAVQLEARPATLPPDAADRAFVRHVALMRGRSPLLHGSQLVEQAILPLRHHTRPVEIVVYCNQNWLRAPLVEAGFDEIERVQFMRLPNIQRRRLPPQAPDTGVDIGPIGVEHLKALAQLDAAAFPPRWHFSEPELLPLLMAGHVRGAVRNGALVGYTALSVEPGRDALLERIAVAPAWHRHGIGRALLVDVLLHARACGAEAVTLNTQNHNMRAQELYSAAGFRWTGYHVPIMTRNLPANAHNS